MLKKNFEAGFIARVLMKNPATFKMLERVYLKEGENEIDQYFIDSLSGQALRSRLDAVIKYGTENVPKIIAENGKIVNYGCGTSRDLIAIISNLRTTQKVENIFIDCIDVDEEALDVAKILVAQKGLTNFNFYQKNFLAIKYSHNVAMAFLIGILCSLPHNHCVGLLKKLKKHFSKNSIVIISNVLNTMKEKDPDMAYSLKTIVGWDLVYKTPKQLEDIVEAAGYQWLGCFFDEPLRFHVMGIATPKF